MPHVVSSDPLPSRILCRLCLGLGGRLSGLSLGRIGCGLSSGGGCLSRWLGLGRCPESLKARSAKVQNEKRISAYQVVPEELHDEGGVFVALLGQGVKLCVFVSSDGSRRCI